MNFRRLLIATCLMLPPVAHCQVERAGEPFPIDPLWESPGFIKAYTGSYGIDSNIEPQLKESEASLLNDAAQLMAKKDRKGAIEKLKWAEQTKTSPALLFSLGNYLFEEKDTEKAIEYFSKAIEIFPNFRDAHRNLAMLYIRDNNHDKAEPHLTRAIELGSKEGLTFGLLAHCHSRKDRFQAALSAYRMAQMTMPDERQWILGEAYTLHALEQSSAANSIYQALLKEEPTNTQLWINQAHTFVQSQKFPEAIANFEVVDRMNKLTPTNRFYLGQLYLDQGFDKAALKHFEKSISAGGEITFASATDALVRMVKNSRWETAASLGQLCSKIYSSELAFKKPEAETETSKEKLDTISKFQRSMALIDLEQGKSEAGAKRVAKLIEQNPLDGEALLLLAQFNLDAEKFDEAISLLEQAALLPEKRANALYRHGMILISRSEYKKALALFEESNRLKPNEGLVNYILELRTFVERL